MSSQRIAPMVLLAVLAVACQKQPPQQEAAAPPAGPAPGTPEWKIQNAMSAGPAALAQNATIMDWPDSSGHQTQLRAGTNGWTCLPDMPDTPANDPWCLDAQWGQFMQAYMAHGAPNTTAVGYAYMLQGSADGSLSDPFKMRPDSGQPWIIEGPHVMIIVPRALMASVNALPDHQNSGGPYVMFRGTPYAHVMMPVRAAQ